MLGWRYYDRFGNRLQRFYTVDEEDYGLLAQVSLGASPSLVYQVPSGRRAVVEYRSLVNYSAGNRDATLYSGGTADANRIFSVRNLSSGATADSSAVLRLGPGDSIYGEASAASSIAISLFGYEEPIVV